MYGWMDEIEKRENTTKKPFANHYIVRLKILPVTYTKFGFDQRGFRSKSKWTPQMHIWLNFNLWKFKESVVNWYITSQYFVD